MEVVRANGMKNTVTCFVCDVEVKQADLSDFVSADGRIYRLCSDHKIALSLTVHCLRQMKALKDSERQLLKLVEQQQKRKEKKA